MAISTELLKELRQSGIGSEWESIDSRSDLWPKEGLSIAGFALYSRPAASEAKSLCVN